MNGLLELKRQRRREVHNKKGYQTLALLRSRRGPLVSNGAIGSNPVPAYRREERID